jgi:hypothetical protein
MIDDELIRKAHLEIGRLNRELFAIHEDEERCKLRRSCIEAQKAEVQLLIRQHSLAQRLAALPEDPTAPIVRIEKLPNGANMVHVDKPKQPPAASVSSVEPPRRRLKPIGLPSMPAMILEALSDGKRARPVEIADYVRRKYWPDMDTKMINIRVWQMAKEGRLAYHDGRYSLPMAPVGSPVSLNGKGVPGAAE